MLPDQNFLNTWRGNLWFHTVSVFVDLPRASELIGFHMALDLTMLRRASDSIGLHILIEVIEFLFVT